MDAVTPQPALQPIEISAMPAQAGPSLVAAQAIKPAMPPEAALDMPVQSFTRFRKSERHQRQAPKLHYVPWLSRLFVFGGALALTFYGGFEMFKVVDVGGVTFLKWVLLILFIANFSWIALACSSGILGFVYLLWHKSKKLAHPKALLHQTAVVMPIYNETPARVFGAMQAMIEDIEATGLGKYFDYFFLSDTTDPDIWLAEERALIAMRRRMPAHLRIYYRHRRQNSGRKAGNIAEFVQRWGGSYEHMLVLDADSLMSADTIVTLAHTMEHDPDSGIIQTLPLIVNRNTLFARVQQFAARIYGPVIAAGLAKWMGRDGNYWGHNAIIRTKAFAAHCGLPTLRGKPPFGGHILSHDFVEAALIRRAGYAVYMLPILGGSYEESPPSLIDVAARDRRWCQGNLQHTRLLFAKGLHICSRQHFITGIMGYVASPFWMMQLLVGIALVLQSSYIRPEYFASDFALFPTWPRFDAARALQLFGVTMFVLLLPKFLGLIIALLQTRTRRHGGGMFRLVVSTLFEIILSSLLAPIMMLVQSGSVTQIIFGRDTGWNPQRRDDGSIPLKDIVRRHRSHMFLGIITLIAGFLISPSLVAWMSPTIAGLILAIPISWASGQLWLGILLRKLSLLATPEERAVPAIVQRANRLIKVLERADGAVGDSLRAIHQDPYLREVHEQFLPVMPPRQRGEVSVDRATAEAKLNDAQTIGEAAEWLKAKERMVILHDRALIAMVVRLKGDEGGSAS